jgi:carbohydrate kinase (thermoresistant glucokinase family)
MGVFSCGKSSVGTELAEQLGLAYIDGDHLHLTKNISTMSVGEKFIDADRAPWLRKIGQRFALSNDRLIIGCLTLRPVYRDWIRQTTNTEITFVHLSGTRELIKQRVAAREDHYMPIKLLDNQFATLGPL